MYDNQGHHGLPLSSSTKSVPPGWSMKRDAHYSFDRWRRDLRLWLKTTDLEQSKIGPAIALRLDGVPRALADEIEAQRSDVSLATHASTLSHGRCSGQNPLTGLGRHQDVGRLLCEAT